MEPFTSAVVTETSMLSGVLQGPREVRGQCTAKTNATLAVRRPCTDIFRRNAALTDGDLEIFDYHAGFCGGRMPATSQRFRNASQRTVHKSAPVRCPRHRPG